MKGRIAVFGDSNCLDDSHSQKGAKCLWLADIFLTFMETGDIPSPLRNVAQYLDDALFSPHAALPLRSPDSTLHLYSSVLKDRNTKHSVPACPQIAWAFPQPLKDDSELRTLKFANERHATYNADLMHASAQRHALGDAAAASAQGKRSGRAGEESLGTVRTAGGSSGSSGTSASTSSNLFLYFIIFAIAALTVGTIIVSRPRNRSLQYHAPAV
jgi:hypothetical protein